MTDRGRTAVRLGLFVAAVAWVGACGDEGPTGPQFGDLQFTPSFSDIGAGTSTTLSLRNSTDGSLGVVLIGVDVVKRSTFPDSLCSVLGIVVLSPSQIAALDSGEEQDVDVTIDLTDATETNCPMGQYDADIFAAVDNRVLGGATVRFDKPLTP